MYKCDSQYEIDDIILDVYKRQVNEEDLSGVHAAQMIGMPCEQVFKTLVLRGEKTGYFVCCIPAVSYTHLDVYKRQYQYGFNGSDDVCDGDHDVSDNICMF